MGWYVGPAMDHYRCVTVYFPKTRAPRVCDTVTFLPHVIPFPEVKLTDFLRQAASDIIDVLTNPPSTTVPSLQAGDPTRNALLEIATQLQRIQPLPESLSSSNPTPSPRVTMSPHLQSPSVSSPIYKATSAGAVATSEGETNCKTQSVSDLSLIHI